MKKIMLLIALTLLLASPVFAAPADIWETGQKTCYDAAGSVITCAGTEQDGDLKPGVAWPTPRFTKNVNGTVTDNLTGLIWLTNANCLETVGGVAKGSGYLTWANALTWSNSLAAGSCGLSDGSAAGDWRLPNRKELLSLVDFEYSNPALSNTAGTGKWTAGAPFDGVQSDFYWSSTTYALYTFYAWYVYMDYGYVGFDSKTSNFYVWPVRGGQSGSLDNLTISKTGSGTITVDKGTLNWSGNTGTAGYIHGMGVTLTAQADAGSTFSGWSGDADCSDGSVTMNSAVSCTATFTLINSVTVPSATGNGNITLTTNTPGCGFYNVAAKTEAQVGNDPTYDFPYGLVEFRLNCSAADVTLTFPGDISGTTYRKYGPTTPGNSATTAWYTFSNVTVNSSTSITLHLVDGQLGDDTGIDGVIVDQGGPGQPNGNGAVAVPTMSEWGMILFMALAGLSSAYYLRRQKRA
jgi:hypothetical protein